MNAQCEPKYQLNKPAEPKPEPARMDSDITDLIVRGGGEGLRIFDTASTRDNSTIALYEHPMYSRP